MTVLCTIIDVTFKFVVSQIQAFFLVNNILHNFFFLTIIGVSTYGTVPDIFPIHSLSVLDFSTFGYHRRTAKKELEELEDNFRLSRPN